MLSKRNKFRLYLILQHRGSHPGFHWSIVLAPKNSNNSNTPDCYRFHVTNSAQVNAVLGTNGKFEWRFEHEPFSLVTTGNVVARILLAKITPLRLTPTNSKESTSWQQEISIILDILQTVPLVQNDNSWTCRIWTIEAFHTLRGSGASQSQGFTTIPAIEQDQVLDLGKKALEIIKARKKYIRAVEDIPLFDIRERPDRHNGVTP
ncbi:hypothetical protein GALMADRAFT_787594 [Galerina marginata CBS 339.88]|uniref:Uncharacterized protein n=1 Tax=Galerina marginata (strain CBS 339.88) TaxID=685588 RepID=A0A067SKU7_GALM3|nr:hypothetical protein GALMADRAFT_787594 [Galerina marginata CBS 339.88]